MTVDDLGVRGAAAVAELRKRGFRAVRPEDGFPEWKAAGLTIARSAPLS